MSDTAHKFPYRWNLSDGYPAKGIEHHGCKVFGTFICGGGSTMGYKLAGFDHLGGVEIDPEVAEVYRINHNPKYLYVQDIRDFRKRDDLPAELFNLDLLDGSPPCSTFSMAGSREDAWGKKKKFREGQTAQTLDDLFFDYIALAERLQPKIVLAENVKGLVQGNARAYVHEITQRFRAAGYKVQLFLLNAASMGVPQKRERVFFVCQREDLDLPKLNLGFDEQAIPFKAATCEFWGKDFDTYSIERFAIGPEWGRLQQGKKSNKYLSLFRQAENEVSATITAASASLSTASITHPTLCRKYNKEENCVVGSFPLDYKFNDLGAGYLIGMSVPPIMTAQIAHQIFLQWLQPSKQVKNRLLCHEAI